jgi:very-short-patch-repair endonuclease
LPDHWLGDQVHVPGTRQRWDMSYQMNGVVTVVEYDGDEHYRHSIKIKGDRAKDAVARRQGYRVVRFPYWIQRKRPVTTAFTKTC